MPEVAGGGALFVDPYSVGNIAHALKVIVSDNRVRKQLSVKAKENAAKYCWNRTAKQILKIIEESNLNDGQSY